MRGLLRIDLAGWQQRLHIIAPCPCPGHDVTTTTAVGVPLALVFENSVSFSLSRQEIPASEALSTGSTRWSPRT